MSDKQPVLITGASGMVGKNLLENLPSGKYDVLAPCKKELNLMEPTQIKTFFEKYSPKLIIHCAGKVGGIQANIDNPFDFYHTNLMMGHNLLHEAALAKVPQILNLGSSCMYPVNKNNAPHKESDLLSGTLEHTNEGYALAKSAITKFGMYINLKFSTTQVKTLIPCNLYGCRDHFFCEKSHLIPAIFRKIQQAIASNCKTVEVWGDGSARRECLFCTDFAKIIVECIGKFESIPGILNIGTGVDYTVRHYYEKIGEISGYKGSFIYNTSKPTGVFQKLLDISWQNKGISQKITTLEDGLKITYKNFQEALKAQLKRQL